MKALRYASLGLTIVLVASGSAIAQNVLRLEPFSENQKYLTQQILADTTATGARPAGRIYEMDGGAIYLANREMFVEANETLHIRSSNNQKAILYLFPTGTGANPQRPPGNLFRTRGGDIILEGLAIAGYYELGDIGNENYEYLYNVQGNLLRTDGIGASLILRNNIFSNINGQIIRTEAATKTIHMEDNILANLGALSTSNFGAGKGLDLRAVAVDSLILINNTFVNYQDRPIRHYNFGNPTAGTGVLGYTKIDHNTFVNGMGFHGVLSLGTVGSQVIITNNMFVDAFAAGEDSTDATRTAEWANTGEQYANGNNRMPWIFSNPNDVTSWHVSNNYFSVTNAGQGFFNTHAEINVGEPLSQHIVGKIGSSAAATAFTQVPDPTMTNVPNLMLGLMNYYVNVANKTKDTPNSTWNPATQDMDRRPITYYAANFDASYSVSSAAYTGGANSFPAGDLNWFPSQKNLWATSIDNRTGLPRDIALMQNYPNPFNPSTVIRYQLAVSGKIHIAVYDLLGREVAVLVNDVMPAGTHSANFDASNLTSGVYIYTLRSASGTITRKMVLMK